MDTQNILAIPHHPPLPRAVSGVFQSVEHPYVVDQPPKRSPMAREFTAVHQQQRQQLGLTDRSYSRTPSSITSSNSSSQSTIHNAAVSSHANRPSTDFSDKDHHSLPLRSSIFSSSSDRCMPSRISRRDSIASTGSSIGSSDDILAGETQTNSMKRARRESIGSNDSVLPIENMRVSERKYTCDWHGCGQAFDRIEHLNRHKRRHTGEKPYRCLSSKCTKLFSRFDNMMQHVGIHSVEGHKTEIPNIKNLSKQGNGRGRARRTSYRGSQDPHEKFRRHVEGALGFGLARCCILPTENPDFSNMTLRPLLNTDVPSGSIPATIDEDAPLNSSFEMPPLAKRPRYDSVVDGMDKHPSLVGGGASSVSSDSSASMSPPNHIVMTHQQKIPGSFAESTIMRNGHINYRPIQLPANYPGMSSHQYYAMQQRQQQSSPHRRPTYPYVPAQQASASPMHRNSLGAIPSALRTSNIRSQPALRRD
ncbi:Up in starvation [Coemansia sp. BCRC 34301]|nr:Up in starvation [Coemansia sp. BCRC 34301]